jgi:hypothetical protein
MRSHRASTAPAAVGARPVFVDRSGRRRRLVAVVGSTLAVVLVAGLGLLLAGLVGGTPLNVPGFPDAVRPVPDATEPPTGGEPAPPRPSAVEPETTSASSKPGSSAGPDPTSPRHIPTQTPTHQAKPTKT